MKLAPETLARKRPQKHPLTEHIRDDIEAQLELGDFPLMTANRAQDLCPCAKPCAADETPDPLGR